MQPEARREEGGSRVVLPDPGHEIQSAGGLAYFWYLDDGDILCDPRLFLSLLVNFDTRNAVAGGERNRAKTEVIYCGSDAELQEHAVEGWGGCCSWRPRATPRSEA